MTINGQQLEYVQHPDCEFTIIMCHHCFQIKSTSSTSMDVQLVCKQISDTQRAKVKFLYERVPALPTMRNVPDHQIVCVEREGRDAESGSDGEDICDPPIRPAFNTTDELPLVKYMFTKVFTAYRSAMSIGLYNAVGKEFMTTSLLRMRSLQNRRYWREIQNCITFSRLHRNESTSKGQIIAG